LNLENQPCNTNSNTLVFANRVDTGTSNSSYPDNIEEADTNIDKPKLEEFIFTVLKQYIYKNNIFVAARIVKKTAKKAQIFKEGWIAILAIPAKL
jgi:hypothetical protein